MGGYFEAHRLAIGKSRLGRASGGFVSPGKEKKPILMKEERRTTFTRPRGFFVSECIRALCVSPRERRSLSRFNCKFLLPDLLANCSTEPVKPLPLRAPVINTEFLTKIIYSLKIIFIFFSFFFLSYITVFFLFDSGIMVDMDCTSNEKEVMLKRSLLQKPTLERDVMNFNYDAAAFPWD